MIEASRVRSIAMRLLEKTKAGLVSWSAHDEDDKGCLLLLHNSVISLTYEDDTAEAPIIRFDILDNESIPLATLSAYDISLQLNEPISDPQDAADSALLTELYREATKFVYKWDVVLADIDQALEQPGKIGIVEVPIKAQVSIQAPSQEPAHAQRR